MLSSGEGVPRTAWSASVTTAFTVVAALAVQESLEPPACGSVLQLWPSVRQSNVAGSLWSALHNEWQPCGVPRRYLQALDYDVTYVRNFTDVDDKVIGVILWHRTAAALAPCSPQSSKVPVQCALYSCLRVLAAPEQEKGG